jgi:hypothetical protein
MSIGVSYDSTHGLVQTNNSSAGFVISGSATLQGGVTVESMATHTLLSGTAITVTAPGFYQVTASAQTVVTIPAASAYPGGMFLFAEVGVGGAQALVLTGSSYLTDRSVFTLPLHASASSAVVNGTRLTTTAGGSVVMISDSRRYLVLASSGSVTLAGTVNF